MLIKYCDRCAGMPYTRNTNATCCPKCNSTLRLESCEEYELLSRIEMTVSEDTDLGEKEKKPFSPFGNFPENKGEKKNESSRPMSSTRAQERNAREEYSSDDNLSFYDDQANRGDVCITGRISQYSVTGRKDGSYRRLLPVRLYQAVVYRQRLEDVLHRFTVSVNTGNDGTGFDNTTEIPVNVHGTIAGGIQLTDNAEAEVRGRFNDGVLMAYDVRIIDNGHMSKVSFQRNVRAITFGIVAAILFVLVCYFGATSLVSFGDSVKALLAAWLICFVGLTIAYFVFSFTRTGIMFSMIRGERRKFPFLTFLIISFALAFLISRFIGM